MADEIPQDAGKSELDLACEAARRAIYDTDGRGMVGRNRNYLEYRVARLLLADRASDARLAAARARAERAEEQLENASFCADYWKRMHDELKAAAICAETNKPKP